MIDLKVVTGYIPIANHPRTSQEYGLLGERFLDLTGVPIHPFYSALTDCWLRRAIDAKRLSPTWSVGDNPRKNSLSYHIVNHQKFEWLCMAAMFDRKPETLVWLDYGIFHVQGVTPEVVLDFLDKIKKNDLAIPGCWAKDDERCTMWGDKFPVWRFCGGVMVVPRKHLIPLFSAVKKQVFAHLALTNNVTWEVNTLAAVERGETLPLRWYQADHNETMFTGYACK